MDHSGGVGLFIVGRLYHDVPDGRAVYLYAVLKLGIVTGILDLVRDVASVVSC